MSGSRDVIPGMCRTGSEKLQFIPSAPNYSGDRSTAFTGENSERASRVAHVVGATLPICQLIAPNFVSAEDTREAWLDDWIRARHERFVADMAARLDLDAGPADIEERVARRRGPNTDNPYDAVGPMEAGWPQEEKRELPWLHGEVTRPETI